MDFKIHPEKHNVKYSLKTPSLKHGKAILPMVAALVIIAACSSQAKEDYPPLAGKPAYNPAIHDKMQMNGLVSNLFADYLKITFETEKKIKLQDKFGTVEFTADGYNEKTKIAYEWVDKPAYKNDSDQKSILSENEIALIKNNKFDSTFILILYGDTYLDVREKFWSFYSVYTNSMMQKNQ